MEISIALYTGVLRVISRRSSAETEFSMQADGPNLIPRATIPQTAANPSAEQTQLRYVGRQPIFDRNKVVFAYELLFRANGTIQQCDNAGNAATLNTLDFTLLLGPDSLTEGRKAFINCTRETLVDALVTGLPPAMTVLEILENIQPDEEVLEACRKLKKAGFQLALDDYDESQDLSQFLPCASYIKVDFKLTTPEQQAAIARKFAGKRLALLAEKVETHEEFRRAREAGYKYFQGYFFCKPTTISAADIPCLQLNYFQILQAAYQADLDLSALETVIKREPALCYRLLRYLNSPVFGLREVTSIRQALVLLGTVEIRKWIAIVAVIAIAGKQSSELIVTSLARAHFCERMAAHVHKNDSDLFLLGMLSLIDAILDRPLPMVLAQLPVRDAVANALLGGESEFTPVLGLAQACERSDWESVQDICVNEGLEEAAVWDNYTTALSWARRLQKAHLG